MSTALRGTAHFFGVALLLACGTLTARTPANAVQVDDAEEHVGPFRAVARADAIRIQVTDAAAPAIPRGELLDAAPAVAQAELDSTGVSRGYAGGPTPGEQVAALPLVANGFSGTALPDYPFIVHSSHPLQPSSRLEQGPYVISAASDAVSTVAEARVGAVTGDGVSLAASTAYATTYRDASGAIVAEARSTVEGFAVGPDFRLGDVSGYAKVTSRPGEEPVVESSFSVGTVTVAGTEFGLTANGAGPGGLPAVDALVLSQVLAPTGVDLRILPADDVAGGTDSGGLQISFLQNVPTRGLVEVTMTFGRVLAVSESAAAASSSTPDVGAPRPGRGADASALPTTSAGSTPTPNLREASPTSVPALSTPATTSAAVERRNMVPFLPEGAARFYVVLIGAGLATAAAGHAFGSAIRRPKWSPQDTRARLADVVLGGWPPR